MVNYLVNYHWQDSQSWEEKAMDSLIPQIVENFKSPCGLKISDSSEMLLTERNLMTFLMELICWLPHDQPARAIWDD